MHESSLMAVDLEKGNGLLVLPCCLLLAACPV